MAYKYAVAVASDVGLVKHVNQDSVAVKVANTPYGEIALVILCDGMGGLSHGEVASSHVVLNFDKWFKTTCMSIIKSNDIFSDLKDSWDELIKKCNADIVEYGTKQNTNVGTTVTAMLLFNGIYYIANVGDGRVYELGTNNTINQITRDQTFIQREIEMGRMTKEQAMNDPRKNVLLQCVGVNNLVVPDFACGEIIDKGTYLLCSDGFRHVISSEEIYNSCFVSIENYRQCDRKVLQDAMRQQISYLIELNKTRNERDNITAVLVTVMD